MLPQLPHLDAPRLSANPADGVRNLIREKEIWFRSAFDAGCEALEICHAQAAFIDGIVGALFASAAGESSIDNAFAVISLGGYGRSEMGLMSDIDLLFLHEGADEQSIARVTDSILYPFWDSKAEIGGATRTLTECTSIMERDLKAFTAMLDARLICGSEKLFGELTALIGARISVDAVRRQFIDTKIEERRLRLKRFDDSIYLLQPNLKEGEGSLREFQTMLWIARVANPEADCDLTEVALPVEATRREVLEAYSNLWRIRHALHIVEGKRIDRLSDAVQPAVAARMGFEGDRAQSAAEKLMSEYYRSAGVIHSSCSRSIEMQRRIVAQPGLLRRVFSKRRVTESIVKSEYGTVFAIPSALGSGDVETLGIFASAKKLGLPLDPETKDLIAGRSIDSGRCDFSSEEAKGIWIEMLSDPRGLGETISCMNECRTLERWFPEIKPVLTRIQHDGYHYYTAGEHSIRALGEISFLATKRGSEKYPHASKVLAGLERKHVLSLATLFHDVGKYGVADHAAAGMEIGIEIAKRLGLPQRDVDDIGYLIKSHLLMSTLAFKRDIKDDALIERFAQSIGSSRRLDLLYLLTFADIKTVGPHVWSDWKGALLTELFERTRSHLDAGAQSKERIEDESREKLAAVREILGEEYARTNLDRFLESLPERYFRSTDAATIAAHIAMTRGLEAEPLALRWSDAGERGFTELSIVTKDWPGLFSHISGVISANGASIVDAQLFTTSDGIAIDVMGLINSTHMPFSDPNARERMRVEMLGIVNDPLTVKESLKKRLRDRFLVQMKTRKPSFVKVDNDVSATDTIVEIATNDRKGLLFAMTSIFHELGCTIERAKITTHIDRVTDVFYIRDASGGRITDAKRIEEMKSKLMAEIET